MRSVYDRISGGTASLLTNNDVISKKCCFNELLRKQTENN